MEPLTGVTLHESLLCVFRLQKALIDLRQFSFTRSMLMKMSDSILPLCSGVVKGYYVGVVIVIEMSFVYLQVNNHLNKRCS